MRRERGFYRLFSDCEKHLHRKGCNKMEPLGEINPGTGEKIIVSKPKPKPAPVMAKSVSTHYCDDGSPISLSVPSPDVSTGDFDQFTDQQELEYADDLDYYVEPFDQAEEVEAEDEKEQQAKKSPSPGEDLNKRILQNEDTPQPTLPEQIDKGPEKPLPFEPETAKPMPITDEEIQRETIPLMEAGDFEADIQSILEDKKKYNKFQQKADPEGAAQQAKKTAQAQSLDDPYHTREHNIFEKIAQNMALANSYDLGAISLEQRFDSFEKDMEEEEPKRNKPAPNKILSGAKPRNIEHQNKNVLADNNQAATTADKSSFIGTDDFLGDLDLMDFIADKEDGSASSFSVPNAIQDETDLEHTKKGQLNLSHGATVDFPSPKKIYEKYQEIYEKFSDGKITTWATNECAIRLSWALVQLGVDISESGEFRKIYKSERSGSVQPSARDFAKWLSIRIGKPKLLNKLPDKYKQRDFNGKEGILYFVHEKHGGNGPGHIDVIYNNDMGSGFYPNGKLWFWEFKDSKWVKN